MLINKILYEAKSILKDKYVFLSTMISGMSGLVSFLFMFQPPIGFYSFFIGGHILCLLPIWIYPEQQINIFTGKKLFKKYRDE